MELITTSRLSRRLDVSFDLIKRRVASGRIKPCAYGIGQQPLFDATRIEEYRMAINSETAK
jgi:hypothetical protein